MWGGEGGPLLRRHDVRLRPDLRGDELHLRRQGYEVLRRNRLRPGVGLQVRHLLMRASSGGDLLPRGYAPLAAST